MDYKKASLSR